MQILCDKVTGVVFCWCPWYAGLGTPAVAALGTKPAPTLAKSVLLLLALLFNDAACSIQNNGLSVVGLLLYIYLVWERNLDLLNFQCINNLLPTVLHCESLVVTSHYLWWHWHSWHRDMWLWPLTCHHHSGVSRRLLTLKCNLAKLIQSTKQHNSLFARELI